MPVAAISARTQVSSNSRGGAVSELQQALADAGFNPGPTDGDFGPQTWGALGGSSFTRGACSSTGITTTWPITALLRAPGRVKRISHRVTSDSKRLFVTNWVEVISDEGRIYVRAEDWSALLDVLARRCPQAIIERSYPQLHRASRSVTGHARATRVARLGAEAWC